MSRLRKKNKTVKRQKQGRIQHQYYSAVKYDGNTLSVESQQDNRPIQRKKYTLKQLRREIPVAAELINKYLDGKIPRSLHRHQLPPHAVSIYPVLPNPVDLGLIPPGTEGRSHSGRRSHGHAEMDDDRMMKLYVSEKGDDRRRNIGKLPYLM